MDNQGGKVKVWRSGLIIGLPRAVASFSFHFHWFRLMHVAFACCKLKFSSKGMGYLNVLVFGGTDFREVATGARVRDQHTIPLCATHFLRYKWDITALL